MQSRILDGHILNIVEHNTIREQSEILNMLKERGLDLPQATLSRRLRKLKIAKVAGVYELLEYSTEHLPQILNMQCSEFGHIILHTHPGSANALAYFFDQKYVSYSSSELQKSPLLGTIAGDDTLLLVTQNKKGATQMEEMIRKDFPYLADIASLA